MVSQSSHGAINLVDVLKFVLKHKGPAFEGWLINQIANYLVEKTKRGELLVTESNGSITGMVIAYPISDKEIYVEHLICAKGGMRLLRDAKKLMYPNHTIIGDRRGVKRKIKL